MTATAAYLRPPRYLVCRRAIGYWTLRAAAGWALVLAVETFGLGAGAAPSGLVGVVLAGTGLVAVAHLVVMPRWRHRVHRWEVTPQAVYSQSGWLNQEKRIAPVSRIQTVDSERRLLQRIFDLTTVTVTTGSAAGPIEINSLDRVVAEQLVAELTQAVQATHGDAT
ncbi:MAG: PH domain-containing protein [Actinobacteria bacterium]|nr:PH domain-containing protein [Actinomycetota bacterium]